MTVGCETCKCDPMGAYNISCSVNTGQCFCKPGVTGQHCDRCLPNHYGFSSEGCSRMFKSIRYIYIYILFVINYS